MADNENEGSSRSFRQNPNNKKRREPPIIDGKVTDVSVTAPFQESDPELSTKPESEIVDHVPVAQPTEAEEPVLFGQASRGAALPSAEPDRAQSPATDEGKALGTVDPVPAEDMAAAGSDRETGSSSEPASTAETEKSSEALDPSVFGSPVFDDKPPPAGAEPMPPFMLPPPQRSPAALLLGGLAVILLLVIAGLLFSGSPRGATDDLKAALDGANARITALEARVDPASLTAKVSDLDQRTTAFDTAIASLKKTSDDLSKRLGDVAAEAQANSAVIAAQAPPTPAPPAPADGTVSGAPAAKATPATPVASAADLAAFASRLDDLAHKVDAVPTEAATNIDLAPLQKAVATLSQRLDAMASATAVDLGPLQSQLAELGKRVETLGHGLSDLNAAVAALPKVDLAPLQAGLAATEQRIALLESALAAPKADDQATEARAVGSADVSRAAPLAVVAQTAARLIDEGRPMAAEVDALRSLGVDDAALAPLSAVAEKGAPTPAALKAQWADAEPAVDAVIRPNLGDSLLDKFAAGARQIVTVRRVGAQTGDDPASLVARIPAALDDGDAAAALAAWAKLPEAARAASQGWADAARSRIDAETAARGLAARAIETLAKAKG